MSTQIDRRISKIMSRVYRALLAPPHAFRSREEFISEFLPEYVRDYSLPTGIRLRPDGRPKMATKGTYDAQMTKRNNVIDAAYEAYKSAHESQISFDKSSGVVT